MFGFVKVERNLVVIFNRIFEVILQDKLLIEAFV